MTDHKDLLIAAGADPKTARKVIKWMDKAIAEINRLERTGDALPADTAVIRELESNADIPELSSTAILALVDSALTNRLIKPELTNDAVSWEWLTSDQRRRDLSALDSELFATLRKCAVATLEARKAMKPNPITSGVSMGTRITRRGRPAKFSAHDFAAVCYVAFLDATGTKPTRRTDAYADGADYGPFREFVAASAEHWRVTASVDWMVRSIVEWIQDADAKPNEHELRFIRSLAN